MTSLFEKLDNESPAELQRRSLDSLDWFRNNVRDIRIRQDQALREGEVVTTLELGKMYMYYYDALHKDTLPYFDKFPLVVPIRK